MSLKEKFKKIEEIKAEDGKGCNYKVPGSIREVINRYQETYHLLYGKQLSLPDALTIMLHNGMKETEQDIKRLNEIIDLTKLD
jgi:hypothetical protein